MVTAIDGCMHMLEMTMGDGDKATVRYVGPVDYTRGTMVGIELDHDRGRNSGVVKGKESAAKLVKEMTHAGRLVQELWS